MKRSTLLGLGALVALGAGASWALGSGDTIYVRARDTRVFKDPDGARPIGAPLQPGDKLVWIEQVKGTKFHKVKTAKGVVGYVLFNTVSATAPKTEVVVKQDGAHHIDAQASAAYGAAARGLTEESRKSAAHAPDPEAAQKAVEDLQRVEAVIAKKVKGGGR
ncbi:MAG: hypothetical protein IRZ16_08525 [Myxococcaceae bacterium]|nr:hypothetical protein [Myxococcaceae bacterium]